MPIKKIKSGKYKIDVSLGTDPITGERIRKRPSAPTKKEAEALEAILRSKHKSKEWISKKEISFPELIELYLNECKLSNKPGYHNIQSYTIDKHIRDYFKKADIKRITHNEIIDFRKALIDKEQSNGKKLSNKSINNLLATLSQLFETAVNEGVINENPCSKVKRLPLKHKKMKFWRPEEFKKFISFIPDDQLLFKTFYTTAYLTGLRCGEMLALQWDDIDPYLMEIDIRKSATYIKGEFIVTEPKTRNSIRRISINNKLLQLLEHWKRHQKELFNSLNIPHSVNTYVFQYKEKPSSKDIFSRKIKYFCKDTDLEPIRLHDFRHSHAALLINQGEDYITIKERLGHASVRTTIDVYGHLYPNKQKEMADKLDDLI
ncbi:tyrosine-type recombinase/integrase [Bacillus sonorensis]|uniref:tyrosine-type recombinase/integrase n=1 Tax=Bacillus subtilis group TaxID=653685 RepID=UPI00227EE8FB|nr:tyrosine-type recombinase/integrase [Bacillus sonorensis]MCZ0070304.1 tyrosine-type recombinase/integrase [Bacillus sonorensis]MCZ0097692.1 tyrosine-type recombinase/integrase [Bacillus sonorensis]MEC1518531.1 tyrosine-type recombinase/integrase [Bacillus sonorensis]